MRNLLSNAIAAIVGLIGLTVPALAGYTVINPPTNEESHDRIFSYIYGGTFVKSGYNYSNGTITAVRVQDYLDTGTPVAAQALVGDPGTTDQFFNANYNYAKADAKFAVNTQNFGYIASGSTTYTKIFDQTGWGYNVGENYTSNSLTAASGKTIAFARASSTDGFTMSSNPAANSDGMDHMVTYEITGNTLVSNATTGNTVERTWLLFFEDAPKGAQVADFDFNDLVVEVQATAVNAAVPEPTTLAMLPIALLSLLRRRA